MAALCNRAGHYIFCPVVSSIYLYIFFFSSPNLSRRRLDVSHTSTHGVALVRISDAGLKRAARGSLEIQDAKKSSKNRHLGTIPQHCRAISSQLRHASTIGRNIFKQQFLLHMFPQYRELRPTSGWDRFRLFRVALQISTGFESWQSYCTALQYWASAKLCGVEHRAPPIFDRAAITLGIDPHSSYLRISQRRKK